MTHQPHVLSNLGLAQKYLDSLPADDISRRYLAGEQYASGWVSRAKFFLSIDSVLSELSRFYQYQPVVQKTYELYQQKRNSLKNFALAFSTVSIFFVHQLAKQNVVLPIFKKFCFLKTHRLFRQYLALAFLPYLLATGYTNYFFLNQTEHLWQIHATRLNNGLLEDPNDSQYPLHLLPISQEHVFVTPYVHKFDLPKKWANETQLFLAPDYEPVEEWAKAPLKEAEDEGEGDEE